MKVKPKSKVSLSSRSRQMIAANAKLGGREIDPDASQFLIFIKPEAVVGRINTKLPLTRLQKACLEYVTKPSLKTQDKLASVRSTIIKAYCRRGR